MNKRELKMLVIVLTSFIVCLGLLLSYIANHKLYRESYVNAMVRGYKLAAGQGVLQIEYALKYGKSIDNFYNIGNILKQIADSVPGIDNILLLNPSGEVLYSLSEDNSPDIPSGRLPANIMNHSVQYTDNLEFYYITVPIRDARGSLSASMVMSLKKYVLDDEPIAFQKEYGIQFLLFAVCGTIILISILSRMKMNFESRGNTTVSMIAVTLLTVLIVGTFNGFMVYMTTDTLSYSTTKIGEWLCSIVQMDINRVLHKGVTIDMIFDLSGWLEKTSRNVPEIKNMYMDSDNRVKASMSQLYIEQRRNMMVLYGLIMIFGCIALQLTVIKGMQLIRKKFTPSDVTASEGATIS